MLIVMVADEIKIVTVDSCDDRVFAVRHCRSFADQVLVEAGQAAIVIAVHFCC